MLISLEAKMTVEIYDGQFDDVESDEERVTKIILWIIFVD